MQYVAPVPVLPPVPLLPPVAVDASPASACAWFPLLEQPASAASSTAEAATKRIQRSLWNRWNAEPSVIA
jgi:hypothetical protein